MGSAHAFESDGIQTRVEGGVSNVFHQVEVLIIASSCQKYTDCPHFGGRNLSP